MGGRSEEQTHDSTYRASIASSAYKLSSAAGFTNVDALFDTNVGTKFGHYFLHCSLSVLNDALYKCLA